MRGNITAVKNHQTKKSVWLIIYRKESKIESVYYPEAVDEALCFGWIDSLCKNRDIESYYLTFTPRNPKKSNWSAPNIERAERMIREGKMTEKGQKHIEIAKEKGMWTVP